MLLKLSNILSSESRRWVIRRKAEVLVAVARGDLSVGDACKRYAISMEEFLAWKSAADQFGPLGLRVTRACPRKLSRSSAPIRRVVS